MKNISIVVPVYNEQQGLPVVLDKIFKVIDDTCEVIVVDDGSNDGTSEVTSQFPCRVIKHGTNRGKGEALKTGITHAKGEGVIWIDADDTYPVQMIPKMAEALKTFDMIVCSRRYRLENIPWFNRIGNWLFRIFIKKIYGFPCFDPCTGLYGAKKCYLERMELKSRRFAIEPEISIKGSRMKLKIREFPIEYGKRLGTSKLNSLKVGFEDLWTILRLVCWFKSKEK